MDFAVHPNPPVQMHSGCLRVSVNYIWKYTESKKYSKDQETMQSGSTPDTEYHMGK